MTYIISLVSILSIQTTTRHFMILASHGHTFIKLTQNYCLKDSINYIKYFSGIRVCVYNSQAGNNGSETHRLYSLHFNFEHSTLLIKPISLILNITQKVHKQIYSTQHASFEIQEDYKTSLVYLILHRILNQFMNVSSPNERRAKQN